MDVGDAIDGELGLQGGDVAGEADDGVGGVGAESAEKLVLGGVRVVDGVNRMGQGYSKASRGACDYV
jgi:hypothetical protein